jgi:hypothetical protein
MILTRQYVFVWQAAAIWDMVCDNPAIKGVKLGTVSLKVNQLQNLSLVACRQDFKDEIDSTFMLPMNNIARFILNLALNSDVSILYFTCPGTRMP